MHRFLKKSVWHNPKKEKRLQKHRPGVGRRNSNGSHPCIWCQVSCKCACSCLIWDLPMRMYLYRRNYFLATTKKSGRQKNMWYQCWSHFIQSDASALLKKKKNLVSYLVERKLATLAIPLMESKWESIFGGCNRKFWQKPNFLVKDEERKMFKTESIWVPFSLYCETL